MQVGRPYSRTWPKSYCMSRTILATLYRRKLKGKPSPVEPPVTAPVAPRVAALGTPPRAAPVEPPVAAPVGFPPAVYSTNEAVMHGDASDGWFVLCNTVYDVTNCAGKHPSVSNAISRRYGIDVTSSYENFLTQGLSSGQGMSRYTQGHMGNCL